MIKTVIFDIGNVLVDFGWEKFFRRFCPDEETFLVLSRATVRSKEWPEIDRGVWTEEELMAALIQNAPEIEDLIRKVFENVRGIITPYDYTIPWIRELKAQGLQVLVLSNFSDKFHRDCIEDMDFLAETDGGILSYRDKLIKPDPAIYQLLLDRYHLNASECVFFDDIKENIEAAKSLGIHAFQFTSKEEADQQLKELMVQ